jgi:hypothetical protein
MHESSTCFLCQQDYRWTVSLIPWHTSAATSGDSVFCRKIQVDSNHPSSKGKIEMEQLCLETD